MIFPRKKTVQFLVEFNQHSHVDSIIKQVHKVKDNTLLNYFLHIIFGNDNFDEERNKLLIPLQDWVGK